MVDEQAYLSKDETQQLKQLLHKDTRVLEGTRGECDGVLVHLELKPGAKTFCAKACHIPHSVKELMEDGVNMLVKIGVLQKVTKLE